MKPRASHRRQAGGFTLVELITVIAILGILVTLTVGAVQGIKNVWNRSATFQMFAALDSAFQRYYDDFQRYPWGFGGANLIPSVDADYGAVKSDYRPATGYPEEFEATIYAVLNARDRHGPYFRGAPVAAVRKYNPSATTEKMFWVYVDGWGRTIRILAPFDVPGVTDATANDYIATRRIRKGKDSSGGDVTLTFQVPVGSIAPVLESLGADEFDDSDNVFNYGAYTQ